MLIGWKIVSFLTKQFVLYISYDRLSMFCLDRIGESPSGTGPYTAWYRYREPVMRKCAVQLLRQK